MVRQSLQDHQAHFDRHRASIEKALKRLIERKEPRNVYEPIRYVLSTGGKRMRAVLVTLSCEAVGGDPLRAVHAAAAIEMLHNFTLVHDDVMDHATLRRGKKSVHEQWDTNTAILAGDEMIALAYRSLQKMTSTTISGVIRVFTEAFVDVCEGQGIDKEFEDRSDITVNLYLRMIRKKTARLLSAASEIGGLIGVANPARVEALKKFGEHLGMAFQVNDDLLDIAGDAKEFGKTIGGDVMERKKTFLFLTALERAGGEDRKFLVDLSKTGDVTPSIISRVHSIYESTCSLNEARRVIARHTRAAQGSLAALPPGRGREGLRWLAHKLIQRTN